MAKSVSTSTFANCVVTVALILVHADDKPCASMITFDTVTYLSPLISVVTTWKGFKIRLTSRSTVHAMSVGVSTGLLSSAMAA